VSLSSHQAVGAYRRWTPEPFDQGSKPEAKASRPPEPPRADAPAVEPPAPTPPVVLPTVEEIEAMYEQARAEGFAAGHAEGAAASRAQTERLAALVAAMDSALDRLDEDIAEEIVSLSIAIARQMVGRAIATDPSVVTDTVREALQQMPQGQVRIHVHPDDVALVREYLSTQIEHGHHRLTEDPAIERGGCRLEAAGSEIDGTLTTRWRRIIEELGRGETNWEDGNA